MSQLVDEKYMRRCFQLAARGLGTTYPNPLVGCVIVHQDRIIGEGYHIRAGEAHAEIHAIEAVKDRSLLKEATLYVNLEPCSHQGRTPPCSDRIIREQIPRVVICSTDSHAKVSGKGIARMREAGTEVQTGVLEQEGRQLNRRFFTFHEKQRPWVVLKWAQSKDGFLDFRRDSDTPVGVHWITGPFGKTLVHKWRSEEEAILVGGETVRLDDPVLNVREWTGRNPQRIVLSRSGRLPDNPGMCREGDKPWLLTANPEVSRGDMELHLLPEKENPAAEVLRFLADKSISSLLVEGGKEILDFFLQAERWDEIRVFTGQSLFEQGVEAPAMPSGEPEEIPLAGSLLQILYKDV